MLREVDAALRNSIVRLAASGEEHLIALREPVVGEPLTLDLRDSTHRVNAKCDWLPPAESMRFAVSLTGQIPVKRIDGPSVESLGLRDETIIVYNFEGDAATKIVVRKAGDSIAAVLASQYVLPSGDVEPLSIARGTRVMQQLQELKKSAANAAAALPGLRTYRQNLDSDLQAAMRMSTGQRLAGGGCIDNPVAVKRDALGISLYR